MTWTACPPVTAPGEFGHLEVPQVIEIAGRWYLLFSVYGYAHAATRRRRARAVTGTHCMVGDDPLGPFSALSDEFFAGDLRGSSYAGKLIADPDGQLVYLAFAQHPDDGPFRGALTDPVPVHIAADGQLRLARTPW